MIKDKLVKDLNLPPAVTSEILADIFGQSDKDDCLANASNEDLFVADMKALMYKWSNAEEKHGRPGEKPQFYSWFARYQAPVFIEYMINPVRKMAGLGDPPRKFYTNTSECLNSLIKRKIDYQKKIVADFVDLMEEMVRDQEARIEEAVIGYGEWSVGKEYERFTVCQQTWFKMNEETRKSHIQRFNSAPLQPAKIQPGQSIYDEEPGEIQEALAIDAQLSDEEADAITRQLPVDAISSGIVSVSEDILSPMWEKAERILNTRCRHSCSRN